MYYRFFYLEDIKMIPNAFFASYLFASLLLLAELFISGFAVVLVSSSNTDALEEHYALFGIAHLLELSFIHLFSVGLLLFIFLHLVALVVSRKRIAFYTMLFFTLLLASQSVWFFVGSWQLKLFCSLMLGIMLISVIIRMIWHVYKNGRMC